MSSMFAESFHVESVSEQRRWRPANDDRFVAFRTGVSASAPALLALVRLLVLPETWWWVATVDM
jgi:hypothetical protein